jgi:hypothetical protein
MSFVEVDSGPTSNDLLRELKAKHARPPLELGCAASLDSDGKVSHDQRLDNGSAFRSVSGFGVPYIK